MLKRYVKWYEKGETLTEIYQTVGLQFSFANEINGKLTQCHQWVKCRDYLHDAVRTELTKNRSEIYGFVFSKNNPHLDLSNIRILVSEKNEVRYQKLRHTLTKALKLINHFESLAGVDFTTLEKVNGNADKNFHHVYLLTGPKMWMSSPYLLSMFTFLVRLGAKDIKSVSNSEQLKRTFGRIKASLGNDNDSIYLNKVGDKLETIIKHKDEISKCNADGFSDIYYKKLPIYDFHNRTGIVSVCNHSTPCDDMNNTLKDIFKTGETTQA